MKKINKLNLINPADNTCFRHVKRRTSGLNPWMDNTADDINFLAATLIETYWTMYFGFSDPVF